VSKRKRKQQRKPRPSQGSRQHQQPSPELQKTLNRADDLIAQGHAQAAIDLLEPLLASHPRVAKLHYYVGYAHAETGDPWGALTACERAMELSQDPGYWLPLALLYLDLELNAHALHAFRQVLKRPADIPTIGDMREVVASLEQSILVVTHELGISASQVEQGLRHMEDGLRALHGHDFPACIAANRRAIKLLAGWPPPRNNLSLALFHSGQPEKAIATARQMLAQSPDNVQALSNAIRFLAWTGRETEARALWPQLKGITPLDSSERLKMAEAAAILNQDELVYQLLKPLDHPRAAREQTPAASWWVQFFLAVAEVNTGRRAARRRLRALQDDAPWAGDLLAALEAGKPGPGWADRFPYYHSSELLPSQRVQEFIQLASREDEMPPQRFRSQVARFAARFPQIVLMAEKMIWEDDEPTGGLAILATVATPALHAALRRFGLSQAGEDQDRMQALVSLMQAGEITQDDTLRVWSDGQWREVQLRQYEISDEPTTRYAPEVAELLNQAMRAFQQDDYEQAEHLFRHALALDPGAKEAYNNLGTIYARRGEHEQAKEMYRAVLEIDPTYAFPRCNLAAYLLDEDDIEGAEAMVEPLADVARLRPQEAAFYSYTEARILIHREEYDAARRALQVALEFHPDYGPAQDLLERLDAATSLETGYEIYLEERRKRDRARRARLQTKLSISQPSVSEALSIYTKEALTAMARVVLLWGGWSGLRKAELLQRIIERLQDPDNLERIVTDLHERERAALRQVLAHGGHMPWRDFDAEYGNDLGESPYWIYHKPETVMGRLRLRGLLVEATVDDELLLTVPTELRHALSDLLG